MHFVTLKPTDTVRDLRIIIPDGKTTLRVTCTPDLANEVQVRRMALEGAEAPMAPPAALLGSYPVEPGQHWRLDLHNEGHRSIKISVSFG